MIIDIKGSTKYNRKLIEEAINFYEGILFKRIFPSLVISIILINKLTAKEDTIGDCIWEDSRTRPREFTIRLDSAVCISNMLETLAHEMVHVHQFSTGKMRDSRTDFDMIQWEGEILDTAKLNYYDYPWEIEAHGRERGLFVRFMQKYGYTTKKWAKNFV